VAAVRTRCVTIAIGLALLYSVAAEPVAQVTVRVIVVEAADDAAKALQELRAGADFAALAREKSIDATAVDGGLLGQVDPATLRPELRDALRDLRPGQLSRVIQLPSGYAILKIADEADSGSMERTERARQAALGAPGSVQYGVQVDGLQEAWSALAAIPKPDGWDRIRKPFVKSIPARTPPSRIGLIVCWSRAMNTAPRNPRTRRRSTGYRCT
jgi:hypothetical protein